MTKRKKVIYWIATAWLALGMLSTGIIQLFKIEGKVDYIIEMGYPPYFLVILGVGKILGVTILLMPKFALLKEWAYAGIFFSMAGAVFSHIAVGNTAAEVFPALLLLILAAVSWYARPASRKLILANQ